MFKRFIAAMGIALLTATAALATITAPTGVTATALSTSSIQVQWTDNSSDETGFRIYMANNSTSAAYIQVGEVAANTTTFTVEGLPASTQRFFRVVAFKHSTYIAEDISSITGHAGATTQTPPPSNSPPVAVDDTDSGDTLTVISGNVLANDTDANVGDVLVVVGNPDIAANGDYALTFNTPDVYEFPYTVSDGKGGTDTGMLTITANNQNPVAVADTAEDTVPFTAEGNVLSNDTDVDGGQFTFTVEQPNEFIEEDGSFSIEMLEPGVFPFNYTLLDGQGGEDEGTLTVTVNNEDPVVENEEVTVVEGDHATGNVLTNDSDPDGHTISVVQPNVDGIEADGTFNFLMEEEGTFEVDYEVTDSFGTAVPGVLTIVVEPPANLPPEAVDDTATGTTAATITGNVLTNDTDPETDPLTVVNSSGPFTIAANGAFSFAPPHAVGIYTVNYTVSDGELTDAGQLVVTVTAVQGNLIAFPGADGAGRFSKGGRGGTVMQVTNLNDSGAGSLRACAEATVPRICVFRVAGYINVESTIKVRSPFITIAGETAPGQGITLRAMGTGPSANWSKSDLMVVGTNDVIIRHIRFRGGHPPHNVSSNGRNLMIGDILGSNPTYNIIADHISASWATDQPMDVSPSNNPGGPSPVSRITLQNSLVYEGLNPHSKGPNIRVCGISMIKNMIATGVIRNPNNTCGKYDPNNIRVGGGVTGETEFRNNVVFNGVEAFFDMWDGRGEAWTNIVGNVFIKGPQTKNKLNNNFTFNIYPVDAWHFTNRQYLSGTCAQNGGTPGVTCNAEADALHIYLNDNIALGFPTNPGGPAIGGVLNPNDAHLVSPTPVGDGAFEDGLTGTAIPAAQVEAYIQANAGAFPNDRDDADDRVLNELATRSGTSIKVCNTNPAATTCEQFSISNYPSLDAGSNYPDTDADGMDDNWEIANGVSLPNADADGDGYTNLEEFLHSRAATR